MFILYVPYVHRGSLSKTASYGPVIIGLFREVAALYVVDFNAVLVLFEAREAGCFRKVAA